MTNRSKSGLPSLILGILGLFLVAGPAVAGNKGATGPAGAARSEAPSIATGSDLEVVIVDRPDPVAANGFLDYTITLKNNGPDTAIGATLTATPPSSARFVSMRAPVGWSCTHPYPGSFGQISCNAPALLPVGSYPIGVRVQAPPVCGHNVTVNHTVFAPFGSDPNLLNNQVTEPTLVTGKPCFGGF